MTLEHIVYLIVFLLWLMSIRHGAEAVGGAVGLYRYIRKAVADEATLREPGGRFIYQPRASVILPCCGVDENLHQTVRALAVQNYEDYEILFVFASEEDPAYAAVGRWTESWEILSHRRIIAGRAEQRGQKIHNLLAAVEAVGGDREVILFLDSDAIPKPDWMGYMVAPLKDQAVGASTGYRWYSATGGLTSGLRCAWNAATVSLLADRGLNFCWGGSTAIRRELFSTLKVADYWSGALSDDLQLSRAVRDGGLQIRFVPQALLPNSDRTTFGSFWRFAQRQVIITRICGREVWRRGAYLCVSMVAGGTAVGVLFGLGLFGWFGTATSMYAALAGWIAVILLVLAMTILRQMAIRRILRPPDLTWRDFLWDVLGTLLVAGSLHMTLVLSTLKTRRFVWRNIEYELFSPTETRVIDRA